jgi:hypothetical protein
MASIVDSDMASSWLTGANGAMTHDAVGTMRAMRGDGNGVEWRVGDVGGDESEDRADVSSANVCIHGKGERHGSVDEEGRNVASLRLKSITGGGAECVEGAEGASSVMSLFTSAWWGGET